MKKKIFLIFLVAVLFVASAIMVGCAKGGNDGTGEEPGQTEQPGGDTEGTDDGEDEGTGGEQGGETVREDLGESVDLVLFIGQSNMAGRGVASEATVVGEGHGFEFRAISDPTKLYPIEEPFGVNENNPESGVNENKKTGSMVSAICESYYQTTGTPIVAVSCSQGGTGINFWDTNRPAYEDACERMLAAKEYLYGDDDYKLRNTFVVWLQGEHDGGNGVTAQRYTKTLANIFDAFKADKDSSLFATSSFWEGVDVPGDTLRLLIIAKLPFSSPTTPMNKARERVLEIENRSSFYEISLPDAVIKFKQGAGRLIRSEEDKGVVLILDGRLARNGYRRFFIESIPECYFPEDCKIDNIADKIESFLF